MVVSKNYSTLIDKTLKRALKYRITDLETIERIASLQLRDGSYPLQPVNTHINEDFQNRESYLEGRLSSEVGLSIYDQMMEDED